VLDGINMLSEESYDLSSVFLVSKEFCIFTYDDFMINFQILLFSAPILYSRHVQFIRKVDLT